MTGRRGPLYIAAVAVVAAAVATGWWLSIRPGGSDHAIVAPAEIPIPTARPALTPAAPPALTSAPPSTARTPPLAATPAQRGTVTGCAAQAEPHGTDDPAAWRPAPLPWSAPCARPPGGPAWRPATSLVTASPDTDPPIRLVARPEILPGGEPADPNTDPPADTLDRVRALSEAWARWLEVDQAADLAADPALIADVAGFVGAEQYTRHYTRLATTRADAGAYDCESLALDAALLAIDLRPEVAHTISWRRGGGAACRVGASPDSELIGTAACAGELRLRYHAWSLIEGEWIMSGVFAAGGRHAEAMRSFVSKQSPAFTALMWRIGHYIDRIEAEYDDAGRPCD